MRDLAVTPCRDGWRVSEIVSVCGWMRVRRYGETWHAETRCGWCFVPLPQPHYLTAHEAMAACEAYLRVVPVHEPLDDNDVGF